MHANQNRLLDVTGWTGTFELTTRDSQSVPLAGGMRLDWTVDQTTHADVTLKWDMQAQSWKGKVSGTVNIDDKFVLVNGDCTETVTLKGSGSPDTDASLEGGLPGYLTLDGRADAFSVTFTALTIAAEMHSVVRCPDTPDLEYSVAHAQTWNPLNTEMGLPIPDTGYDLAGTKALSMPLEVPFVPGTVMPHTASWRLRPTGVQELEVIVEPEGYDRWRPEAGKDEQTIGNTIAIHARLQYTDGTAPADDNRKAQQFIFELTGTSHEPGIALNYPLAAKAQATADLKFDPTNQPASPALYVTDAEGQRAETQPGALTQASAVLSSFDWGGWTELKVTAELLDGRRIVGHLQGDKTATQVLLPKRERSSHIAGAWKTSAGTSASDDDDSEADPVGLAGCSGDGLTLYEEYRGFYENGQHIEGDPKKKDFFILNLIGADAEPGIWLFTDLTGLEVHARLTQEELYFVDRLVNGNHSEGAHRVDQHGVFLVTNESIDGAAATFFEASKTGRPGLTRGISVQPRNAGWGTLAKPYALQSTDRPLTYDVAVAHEILHTIGADHHGDVDQRELFQFVYPDDPSNAERRPIFRLDSGARVEIIDEASKADLAQESLAYFLRVREAMGQAKASYGVSLGLTDKDFEAALLSFTRQEWVVGMPQGQHSGDDQCVMRYFMARVYPIAGAADRYYFIPIGTEPLGAQICESAAGAGVNQAGRVPQPRYFNAAAHRGDCRHRLCVNDGVPPEGR